jgi:hypothetical protein
MVSSIKEDFLDYGSIQGHFKIVFFKCFIHYY